MFSEKGRGHPGPSSFLEEMPELTAEEATCLWSVGGRRRPSNVVKSRRGGNRCGDALPIADGHGSRYSLPRNLRPRKSRRVDHQHAAGVPVPGRLHQTCRARSGGGRRQPGLVLQRLSELSREPSRCRRRCQPLTGHQRTAARRARPARVAARRSRSDVPSAARAHRCADAGAHHALASPPSPADRGAA